MKRRQFLTTSAAVGLGLGLASVEQSAAQGGRGRRKQLIELRVYHFADPAKLAAFDQVLKTAIVPAANRIGITPIGTFKLLAADNPGMDQDSNDLYVLIPHKGAETLAGMLEELVEGLELDAEAAKVLNAPKSDPAYVRYESSLFLAFDQAPQVEVPTRSESRLMQLRIYESHNTERALKKIEMFNTGGELAVFRECGMHPVFFGQALVGSKLPNLTYMLAFDDAEAQKAGWDKFRDHPDWKRLSGDPAYADTVTDITNLVLRPTPASQI